MKLFAIISAATVTLASFTSTANAETSSIATKEAPTWTKDPVIPEAYNLILTELKCWKSPLPWTAPNACPNLSPGVYLPDHDEKFQMMQANILRMFPQTHQNSIYAKKYTFYAGDPKCGQAQQNPYMLSHNGIEHGRYYAKSRTECKTPIKGHATCAADCKLFGTSCLRMKAFRNGRNGYIRSEAICGQSDVEGCLRDGHCGIFFLPERNLFSIGMAKGSGMIINGWRTSVDANKRWALAMGAHFDRNARAKRSFVAGDNDATLLFQTVYYNTKNAVKNGYLLYQGGRLKMSVKLGDANRGIYELDMGSSLPNTCEPYYFHFELSDGSTIRLPEDPRYMYGTAGINGCAHNHYYDSGDAGVRAFKANAGPNVDGAEECVGCNSIDYEDVKDAPVQTEKIGSTAAGRHMPGWMLAVVVFSTLVFHV